MPVESIGPIFETKIPGLADAADIQKAFYAYHYGAYTSVATTAGIITPSIAKILKDIHQDIADLEARPSSGGDVANTAPVAGDFTPAEIPNGYIWVDQDGSMTSSVIGATAIYNNDAPTSNLTAGIIWVDKDASTSTTGNPFIPQAIIAAKGDLLAGSANDTVVVLTVGSNGQYLKADSSTASGLTWGDPGDLTAVSAGTGITVTNGTGPIPSVAVDTSLVATTSNTMTLSNKTLTSPIFTGTTEIAQILEAAAVTSYSATGTVVYNVLDQGAVAYFTSSASSNWVLNLRGSSTTSLVNLVNTGESLTIAMLVTNGATAFYQSAMQIDGTAVTSVTKWQGGTAPSSGNASSVDIYSITAVKVANTSTVASAFTVFASQTQFA